MALENLQILKRASLFLAIWPALACAPAWAQDDALIPDGETVQAMEKECAVIIEDRWSKYSPEYRRGQVKEELVISCVENAKLQYFSTAQNQMNRESAERAAASLREYEAAVVRRQEIIAEQKRAHEAAMRQWREDVDACNGGDFSRCAQPNE